MRYITAAQAERETTQDALPGSLSSFNVQRAALRIQAW